MSKMDWNAPYIDHRTWILDHIQDLHVNSDEAMVLLLIDFMNQTHTPIDHEALSAKTKLDVDQIEEIFLSLSDKGYLTIDFHDGALTFHIDGVYEEEIGQPLDQSLIERIETEFGRPLSPNEMQRILDLEEKYPERMVVCALNEAVVYNKLSLNYIESILVSWKQKGLTVEEVENGIRDR